MNPADGNLSLVLVMASQDITTWMKMWKYKFLIKLETRLWLYTDETDSSLGFDIYIQKIPPDTILRTGSTSPPAVYNLVPRALCLFDKSEGESPGDEVAAVYALTD